MDIVSAIEEWRQVADAPNYEVSSLGRIRRLTPAKRARVGEIRKTYLNNRGYEHVSLAVDGRPKGFQVHRLVAKAFFGESPLTVNHKNGKKADNRVCNLEYASCRDNSLHAYWVLDSGPHGERHHHAKLDEKKVAAIWQMRDAGMTTYEIAEAFGCTATNVQLILRGKAWARVSAKLGRIPSPSPQVSSH